MLEVIARPVSQRQLFVDLPLILREESVGAVIQLEERGVLILRRHRVRKRQSEAGMDRRRRQNRPPEIYRPRGGGRAEVEQRGQSGKDDSGGEEEVPLGIVAQEIEVDSALHL